MATAAEVRKQVRAKITEQLATRESAALAVLTAQAAVEDAEARLDQAREELEGAVTQALTVMKRTELTSLTGLPLQIRRNSRKPAPDDPQ